MLGMSFDKNKSIRYRYKFSLSIYRLVFLLQFIKKYGVDENKI
jgi:hypothetical protein